MHVIHVEVPNDRECTLYGIATPAFLGLPVSISMDSSEATSSRGLLFLELVQRLRTRHGPRRDVKTNFITTPSTSPRGLRNWWVQAVLEEPIDL